MEVCRWCSGYVRAGGVMVGVQGGWERGGTECDAGTESNTRRLPLREPTSKGGRLRGGSGELRSTTGGARW